MIGKTKHPIPSVERAGYVHPAGTRAVFVQQVNGLVQQIDGPGVWFVELRVPDDSLVGGAWYETVELTRDDVELDPGVAWPAWASTPRRADFHPGLYEHYTGGKYLALHLVTHHESGELFVVYVPYDHPESGLRLREWATQGKDSWSDSVLVVAGTRIQQIPGQHLETSLEKMPRYRYIGRK